MLCRSNCYVLFCRDTKFPQLYIQIMHYIAATFGSSEPKYDLPISVLFGRCTKQSKYVRRILGLFSLRYRSLSTRKYSCSHPMAWIMLSNGLLPGSFKASYCVKCSVLPWNGGVAFLIQWPTAVRTESRRNIKVPSFNESR